MERQETAYGEAQKSEGCQGTLKNLALLDSAPYHP